MIHITIPDARSIGMAGLDVDLAILAVPPTTRVSSPWCQTLQIFGFVTPPGFDFLRIGVWLYMRIRITS
jgi:hypothetical protein